MRCTHIHTCVRCMHTCCVAHTTRITFQKVNKRNLYSNLSPSHHTRNLHYFVSFPFISLLQSLGCAPRVMFPFHFSPSVTRVRSQGHVSLNVNVVTKDLWKQGYRNGAKEPPTNVHTVTRGAISGQPVRPDVSSS